MEKKIELMKSLLNLYEQYESIKNDYSAETVGEYIKNKEEKLAKLLLKNK